VLVKQRTEKEIIRVSYNSTVVRDMISLVDGL